VTFHAEGRSQHILRGSLPLRTYMKWPCRVCL